MKQWIRRQALKLRQHTKEWLRYSPATTWAASKLFSGLSRVTTNPLAKLQHLDRALRVNPSPRRASQLRNQIDMALSQIQFQDLDWAALEGREEPSQELPKGILVKAPISNAEKGVLYLTFENQWLRLLRSGRASEIAQRYDLVLGPSFSPPPELALLLMLRFWPGRIFTLLGNPQDEGIMTAISPRLVPIPLLSSSWVDPDPIQPFLSSEKKHDIVMLANFASFKRHWLFFDVLRKLPKSTRVLLLGVPLDGRDVEDIRREAAAFGVEQQCDIVVRPNRDEILRGVARSRCSLIFSRQEGGCIAVAESLFANVPVGVLHSARVGSRDFIHKQTGELLHPRTMVAQIQRMISQPELYQPREWALQNISCHVSLNTLNCLLRQSALDQGKPWTRDLVPFTKGRVPQYLTAETAEEMQPAWEEFVESFGLCPTMAPTVASKQGQKIAASGSRDRAPVGSTI